ncbi:hypothetical protein NDU88_004210 [Pleurodeles waltl]|uniref:Uncharacterized protein n=1 Tax=Pleurodeles waltl TaxID=8319 RepID=A0AAV7MTA9_PLEWA|nr:hypothetical protein NDU88_004210 [Pleurodeles waltl]
MTCPAQTAGEAVIVSNEIAAVSAAKRFSNSRRQAGVNRSSRVVELMVRSEERLNPLNGTSARRRARRHHRSAATCRLVQTERYYEVNITRCL